MVFMSLDVKDFIQDACKATPGFEYYPKKFTEFDLKKIIDLLRKNDYYISKDNSPFYVHVKRKNIEMTVFSSGKIIIKNTEDEDEGEQILKELLVYVNMILDES